MLTINSAAMRACTKGAASPRSHGTMPVRAVRLPVSRRTPVTQAVFKGQDKKSKNAPPPKQKPLRLGFTKENELFVGRAAMLGFAFSLIGEVLTGKGALAQLGYEIFDDKINIDQIDELVVGLIVFNLVAAILPTSGTFKRDDEEEEDDSDPKEVTNPFFRAVGVKGFGFTKENELFVGRVAQLGFAASLIGETLTGRGPLAQFDFETGISLRDTEFGLLVFIGFFFFAAINPGTGKFVPEEEEEEEPVPAKKRK